MTSKAGNASTYQDMMIWETRREAYSHIQIWWYDALLRYIAMQRYKPYWVWHRFYHSIVMQRCRSANRPIAIFSGFDSADVRLAIANPSQFPAMSSYQSIQSNAILGHPRAKIIATRLHYALLLLRIITSPNKRRRYPRVFSLNKGDTDSVGNVSQCYAVTLA